jgi:hypothetical protein
MCGRERSGVAAAVLPALPVLSVLLALSLGACTDEPEAQPSPPPSPTATEQAPALRQRPAPYAVRFGKVAGHLPQGRRGQILRALARPVRAWVDGGFVQGPWPRRRFRAAFAPFGQDIAARARRDAGLLTLYAEGRSLVEVVPQQRRIAVSVTTARRRVVGATARVNLRVLGVDRRGRETRVSLRGDVYLTRTGEHGWQIFGYDLDRWAG